MPVWKKYLTLLLLAGPLAGWAGWTGAAGSRDVLVAAPPPAELGMPDPKAQAKTRQEATTAAADARLVARAALRFEPAPPEGLTDKDAKAAAAVAAARAAEFVNLRSFLAGRGEFVGPADRQGFWQQQHRSQGEARDAAKKIDDFRVRLPATATPAELKDLLDAAAGLFAAYREKDGFNKTDAANWELSVRAKAAAAGYAWAEGKYREILDRPADPAEDKEWADLRAALPLIRGVADAVARAETDTPEPVSAETARHVEEARRLRTDWEAREALFTLFAQPPGALAPDQLAVFFEGVQKVYGALKRLDPGRRLIYRKVQAFCGGFVPGKLWLGTDVYLGSLEKTSRSELEVIFTKDGKDGRVGLTDDPLGLNEHNFLARLGKVTSIRCRGDGYNPDKLKATKDSGIAIAYTTARQKVNTWSADTVKKLAGDCDEICENKQFGVVPAGVREIMEAIPEYPQPPGGKQAPARVTARLAALAAAIGRHPTLFDPAAR